MLYLDGGVVIAAGPPRPLMLGYTTFTTTGALGGRMQANQRCATEYPGSHLCTRTEFHASRTSLTPPSPGAFLDNAVDTVSFDPDTFGPCASFTFATTSYNATVALPSGQSVLNTSPSPNCTTTMPLACCD